MSLLDAAVADLREDEGEVLHLYYDSRGVPTIGRGANLREGRIPESIARQITITREGSDALCALRLADAERDVALFLPWTAGLDEVRRAVLATMAYNMGIGNLLHKNPATLAACERGDYAEAAREMLDGPWKEQVGHEDGERTSCRAHRLAHIMDTGVWPARQGGST